MAAGTTPHSSMEVEWWTRQPEVFQRGLVVFDVRLAKTYLSSRPVPIRSRPIGELTRWLQPTRAGRPNHSAARLEERRLKGADSDVPLVVAATPRGEFLIDGHHRLERGRRRGRREFPVALLQDPSIVRRLMLGRTNRWTLWWMWRPGPAPPVSGH
jgi:hypothetical protein